MIGQHLLLSPVNTVVQPAEHGSAHRPDSGGSVAMLSDVSQISRRHARLVEEHRFDLCGVVLNEFFGLITCRRVRFSQGAERHIRWIREG